MRNEAKCIDACKHIYYEVKMLNLTAARLEQTADEDFQHALLESFLIHCRNLIDFFAPTDKMKHEKDNIVAEHYIQNWPDDIVIPQILEKNKKQINKWLSHLSYSRNTEIQWSYNELQSAINDLMKRFIEKAPKEQLSEDLRTYQLPRPLKPSVFTTSTPQINSKGGKLSTY
jgi:hypothetical protein